MSGETKATPGPWTVDPNDWEQINGADGMSVALLHRPHRTVEEGEANGELIVRAVNSHADLLGALREFVRDLERIPGGPAITHPARGRYDRAIAAIAKATGEGS